MRLKMYFGRRTQPVVIAQFVSLSMKLTMALGNWHSAGELIL